MSKKEDQIMAALQNLKRVMKGSNYWLYCTGDSIHVMSHEKAVKAE